MSNDTRAWTGLIFGLGLCGTGLAYVIYYYIVENPWRGRCCRRYLYPACRGPRHRCLPGGRRDSSSWLPCHGAHFVGRRTATVRQPPGIGFERIGNRKKCSRRSVAFDEFRRKQVSALERTLHRLDDGIDRLGERVADLVGADGQRARPATRSRLLCTEARLQILQACWLHHRIYNSVSVSVCRALTPYPPFLPWGQ